MSKRNTRKRKAAKKKPSDPNFTWPTTVKGFSQRWNWSPANTYNLIAAGVLPSIKINGSRRILPKHEQAMIEAFEADQEDV